jgi:hypothetical protein
MTLPQSPILAVTAGEQIIEQLEPDLVTSLAALHGAPAGVAELAFAAFPTGTRSTLQAYGLMQESLGEGITITNEGRAAILAASQQIPEPYEDVSLDELSTSTRAALDELIAAGSGVRIREPEMHFETMGQPISRIREMGGNAAERLAALAQRFGKHDDHSGSGSTAGV